MVSLILYQSYALNILLKKRTRGHCIVLMYHRILPTVERAASFSHEAITLQLDTFEKQIAYLRDKFNVLSINELILHLKQQKPFPPKSILITFDDGWKDNYLYAMPILKKYKVPALIFLSTGFVDNTKSFWQEHMSRLIWDVITIAKSSPEVAEELDRLLGIGLAETASQEHYRYLISDNVQRLKANSYETINNTIESLESIYSEYSGKSIKNSASEFLSWGEIRKMQKKGIDFGSHGVNHLILDKEGIDIEFELTQSKSEIENKLNTTISTFSYPNGNHNEKVMEKVKSSGYQLSFGTQFGYNELQVNPLSLKRVNITQDAGETLPLFLGRISGLW